jgi:hypothetical protein
VGETNEEASIDRSELVGQHIDNQSPGGPMSEMRAIQARGESVKSRAR